MNLYENMRCHGVPLVTISRGRVVYENGVFMCAEGTGKFCPLRSFPDSVYKKLVQREKVRPRAAEGKWWSGVEGERQNADVRQSRSLCVRLAGPGQRQEPGAFPGGYFPGSGW